MLMGWVEGGADRRAGAGACDRPGERRGAQAQPAWGSRARHGRWDEATGRCEAAIRAAGEWRRGPSPRPGTGWQTAGLRPGPPPATGPVCRIRAQVPPGPRTPVAVLSGSVRATAGVPDPHSPSRGAPASTPQTAPAGEASAQRPQSCAWGWRWPPSGRVWGGRCLARPGRGQPALGHAVPRRPPGAGPARGVASDPEFQAGPGPCPQDTAVPSCSPRATGALPSPGSSAGRGTQRWALSATCAPWVTARRPRPAWLAEWRRRGDLLRLPGPGREVCPWGALGSGCAVGSCGRGGSSSELPPLTTGSPRLREPQGSGQKPQRVPWEPSPQAGGGKQLVFPRQLGH